MPRKPLLCQSVVLSVVLPLAAFGDCPTGPEDLLAGIEIGYADGSTSVLTRDDAGLIVDTAAYNDGTLWGYRTVSLFGYALLSFAHTENGVEKHDFMDFYSYPGQRPDRFRILQSPNQSLSVTRLDRYSDGATFKTLETFTSKDPEQINLGDCTYTVIPIETDESGFGDLYHFIPQIGVAIYVDAILGGMPDDLPPPTSIRALADAP